MNKFLNYIYAVDSILLMLYIFLIKEEYVFDFLKHPKIIEIYKIVINYIPYKIIILGIAYLVVLVILDVILLMITPFISNIDKIERETVDEIENATEAYLPCYLGYFFVALSISNFQIFLIIFTLIFFLTKGAKLAHFNPVLILFGYRYYFCKIDGVKNLLITKDKLKNPKNVEYNKLYRINDFTFIKI